MNKKKVTVNGSINFCEELFSIWFNLYEQFFPFNFRETEYLSGKEGNGIRWQ